ncbi:MAG: hypothetical protein HZB13_11100, partial [Acidobacteria bacterium]|nr:hypothetical protein [Acidobacteriota bacterium]
AAVGACDGGGNARGTSDDVDDAERPDGSEAFFDSEPSGDARDGEPSDDGGRPDGGEAFFDPLAPSSLAQLFETASAAIAGDIPQHELSFNALGGIPQGSAPTYEQTPFRWNYTVAATDISGEPPGAVKGVEVVWPGWTATVVDAAPMGAYLAPADIPGTVPLSLGPLFRAIADDGVNPDACPITSAGTPPGGILLHGNLWWPAGAVWSWNIWCDGPPDRQFYFDTMGNPTE